MATVPFFYSDQIQGDEIVLNEETSKHVVQVLRMGVGEQILITNGRGGKAKTTIADDHRKQCRLKVESLERVERALPEVVIGLSLLKNNNRFEWFLEKATEIGIQKIIPLICKRTSKEKFRYERMQNILISAMLQSQQCWLPELEQPMEFAKCLHLDYEQKMIAHCEEDEKHNLSTILNKEASKIILIGPEGDFTETEIASALQFHYTQVSLGETRLRTETAGIVAASLMRNLS